jgi:hypothetical protein
MDSPFEPRPRPASLGRGDRAAGQATIVTLWTAVAVPGTYGRPRAYVTVTGGSCATHVPPIVSVVQPGAEQTTSIDPRGRALTASTSSSTTD